MLTKRQKEIFHYISTFQNERGIAPTVREVAAAFGLGSAATAWKHMNTLKAKGYLQRNRSGWRSLALSSQADVAVDQFRQIPIIGKLSFDRHIELFATITTHQLPKTLLPQESTYYGFIIVDNSFADQFLLSNDLVIIDTLTKPAGEEIVLTEDRSGGAAICEYSSMKKNRTCHGKISLVIRNYCCSSESGSKSSKL